MERKLLLRECEDLREVCREIYSRSGLELEGCYIPDQPPRGSRGALERILESLKVYFILISHVTSFASGNISTESQFECSTYSSRRISTLAYSIWRRIDILTKAAVNAEVLNAADELERGRMSQGSQTAEMDLRICENCHISKEIIRRVVCQVEQTCANHNLPSRTAESRQELRPKLDEVTDWHTLQLLAEVIMVDLNNLLSKSSKFVVTVKKKQASRRKLLGIIKSLETQLGYGPTTQTGTQIQKLNQTISDLKEDLRKSHKEADALRTLIKEKEQSKQAVESEMAKLEQMSKEGKDYVSSLESKFDAKINETALLMNKYEKEIRDCNKTIVNVKLENKEKQSVIEQQLISIENMEKRLNERKTKESKLKESVIMLKKGLLSLEDYKKENLELRVQLREKMDKERKLIEKTRNLKKELSNMKLAAEKETPTTRSSTISLSGEPEIDLKVEKTVNENRIKLLKEKNNQLDRVLSKIHNSRNVRLKSEY